MAIRPPRQICPDSKRKKYAIWRDGHGAADFMEEIRDRQEFRLCWNSQPLKAFAGWAVKCASWSRSQVHPGDLDASQTSTRNNLLKK
jgi:hypothetical protein